MNSASSYWLVSFVKEHYLVGLKQAPYLGDWVENDFDVDYFHFYFQWKYENTVQGDVTVTLCVMTAMCLDWKWLYHSPLIRLTWKEKTSHALIIGAHAHTHSSLMVTCGQQSSMMWVWNHIFFENTHTDSTDLEGHTPPQREPRWKTRHTDQISIFFFYV